MKCILRRATVIDPASQYHMKKVDILIDKGFIQKISRTAIKETTKHEFSGVCVSPGWLDIGTHSGEPGFEYRETMATLHAAAAAGGFTGLAIMPDTLPILDQSTSIKNIKMAGEGQAIDLYPIGAISKGLVGQEINEYYDMAEAGAVAFSDGIHHEVPSGMMMRALDYSKGLATTIIHHPAIKESIEKHQMHEGAVNITLGLTGDPSVFEKIQIERDINLAKYSDASLLIHLVSSEEGLKAVKEGKKKHSPLYASVSFRNVIADEHALENFDPLYKVQPPLRSSKDKSALVKGIKDGTIDILCSNHVPLEADAKALEFTHAEKGAIGLQSCFSALHTALADTLDLATWIPCLSNHPYKALGLTPPVIAENTVANLTIFDPKASFDFTSKHNLSKSSNDPYIGRSFTGKVLAIFNNDQLIKNQ